MTVLSRKEIIKLIQKRELSICPIIFDSQITDCGIDLRLGTKFAIFNKTSADIFDPMEDRKKKTISFVKEVNLKIGETITIHPNQFFLSSTLEYFNLPDSIMAYVIGRSSWGRIGLVIATATLINPGYAGIITLELTNVGEIPIKLYPGTRIAQVVFHEIKNPATKTRKSKYQNQIKPVISKILDDYEWNIIQKINDEFEGTGQAKKETAAEPAANQSELQESNEENTQSQ